LLDRVRRDAIGVKKMNGERVDEVSAAMAYLSKCQGLGKKARGEA
jgi:hypothetical protein